MSDEIALACRVVPAEMHIRVANLDCLEAVQALLDMAPEDHHVAVLNMANEEVPGGGWLGGAGAQEENLHRRTNLSDHLSNHRQLAPVPPADYPLGTFGCIFSREVMVFRGAESSGYHYLPKPFTTSVLTAAAYASPPCVGGRLTSEFEAGTCKKITHILRVARLQDVI